MTLYHRRVAPDVGRNPVARAVAQRKFESAVRDQKIRLLMSEDGEPYDEFMHGVELTLKVMALAAGKDPRLTSQHPLVRVIRGALSACDQMAGTGLYQALNTSSVLAALDATTQLNSKVDPRAMNRALHEMKIIA